MPSVNNSVKDLKAVLKREKAKGKFQGNFSTMRKMDLLSAVTQLGYAVSVGAKTTSTRRPRKTTSTKRPRKTKTVRASKANPLIYDTATGTYVKAANVIAPIRRRTPEAAVVVPVVATPKRRGRPPKAAVVAAVAAPRKTKKVYVSKPNPLVYDTASSSFVKAANVIAPIRIRKSKLD